MVLEAGGVVGTYATETPNRSIITDRMLASNGKIHDALRDVLIRVGRSGS